MLYQTIGRHAQALPSQFPLSIQQLCLSDNLADWESYEWNPQAWVARVHDLSHDRDISQGKIAPDLQRVEVSLNRTARKWKEEDKAAFECTCKRYKMQHWLGKRPRT